MRCAGRRDGARGRPRQMVLAARRGFNPRGQIDHALRNCKHVGLRVPLLAGRGEPLIVAREPFHRCHGFCRCDGGCHVRHSASCGHLPTDFAGQGENAIDVIGLPDRTIPDQPAAPVSDKTQLVRMPISERKCEGFFAELWRGIVRGLGLGRLLLARRHVERLAQSIRTMLAQDIVSVVVFHARAPADGRTSVIIQADEFDTGPQRRPHGETLLRVVVADDERREMMLDLVGVEAKCISQHGPDLIPLLVGVGEELEGDHRRRPRELAGRLTTKGASANASNRVDSG